MVFSEIRKIDKICFCFLLGDFFGMVMAIASLMPVFIVVSFATLIVFRRDLHTVSGRNLGGCLSELYIVDAH